MNKDNLVSMLEVLRRGLEKNKELPVYEHFCFTGSLAFSCKGIFTIATEFDVPKPFAVNGFTFLELLQATQAEDVKFTVEGTDLIVKAGKSDFELPIKTPDEFIWKEPEIEGFELGPEVAGALKYVLKSCSENQALEGYARICIKSHNGSVVLYSTDGDALTRYDTGLQTNRAFEFCLGREYCQIVNDIAYNGRMKVSTDWVCVETNAYKVYSHNLGAPTIDYEVEMATLLGNDIAKMVPIPQSFGQALTRAIVVASIETKPTTIIIENGEMSLITETPFGNVYDTIKTDHEAISTKINAELLQAKMDGLDMIKFIKTCIVLKNQNMIRLVANMG